MDFISAKGGVPVPASLHAHQMTHERACMRARVCLPHVHYDHVVTVQVSGCHPQILSISDATVACMLSGQGGLICREEDINREFERRCGRRRGGENETSKKESNKVTGTIK